MKPAGETPRPAAARSGLAARPGAAVAAEAITSAANPTFGAVRSLIEKRESRARDRAFVVEGRRAVADAIAAGAQPQLVLLREGAPTDLPADLLSDTPVRLVASRLFDRLSDLKTPPGLLAVFPFPEVVPPTSMGNPPLALLVDRLRDPGNLGTLLRAAAAAGVGTVFLTPTTVDPFNPKVVRAGMGAHFRVALRPLAEDAAADLAADYPLRAVARAGAPTAHDAVDWTVPALAIIGGETEGMSATVAALASVEIGIPLHAGVESLNAAVAGAVVLFEAARQRRQALGGGR